VQVIAKEDMMDTDEEENSPRGPLASTTYIKQTREEDKSEVLA